jgi:hypothetical protein
MEAINLDKAIQLYDVIGKYLPDREDIDDPLEYVHEIIHSILSKENHIDYINAISIMTGYTNADIIENSTSEEALSLFIEGLTINKIIELKSFMENIEWQTKRS